MKTFSAIVFALLASGLVCRAQPLYISQQGTTMAPVAAAEKFLDAGSFTGNCALLASTRRWRAGLTGERKFLLPELSFFSAVASLPIDRAGIGMDLVRSGDAAFNETRLGIAYGRSLGKKLSLGIGFSYRQLSIAGYGKAGGFAADLGLMFQPVADWHVGVEVSGLPAGQLGKTHPEKAAARFSLQLGFEASDQVLLELIFYKEERQSPAVKLGIFYQLDGQLFFAIGIDTGTASPYGRAGWQWKRLRVLLGVRFHPVLGATPTLYLMTGGDKSTG